MHLAPEAPTVAAVSVNDMRDRIHLSNGRQKFIPEPFALVSTFHEPRNIDKLDDGRNNTGTFVQSRKFLQPLIGHLNNTNIRIDGTKRIIRTINLFTRNR